MKKCFNFIAALSFLIAVSGVNFTFADGCIDGTFLNNGKCSFTGNCWPDAQPGDHINCDSTAPNQGGGGDPGGGGGTIDPINP